MVELLNLDIEELKSELERLGEKPFRAKQVYKWLHMGTPFGQMTDLSLALQEKLTANYNEGFLRTAQMQCAADGTKKYLFELSDQNTIESVYLPKDYGNSICISTQVGCAQGCAFCASCRDGLVRNLSAGEMLAQIVAVNLDNPEHKVTHIVMMGMGEPLDNYEQCIRFLHMVNHPQGLNIGKRNISLSTCGIVENIKRLAVDFPGITLSVSLHAPTQKQREKIMPTAKKYPLRSIVEEANEYFQNTGRRVTYEYTVIAGVNDSGEDVEELKQLLRGMNCHVNLIPLNPTGLMRAPGQGRIYQICEQLNDGGISATVRKSMGSEIEGACGQLRQRNL